MQCVHRKAADVRWTFFPLLVLISVPALPTLADDFTTTLLTTSETVTNIPVTENPTFSTTLATPLNATSTTKPSEVSTKKVEVPTETTEGTTKKSELVSEKVEVSAIKNVQTAGKQEQKLEKKRGETHNDTTEKPDVTVEAMVETAEKRNVTETNVEVTAEKLHDEESQTESASELALQSVQSAVVVKAPRRQGVKISIGNSTDHGFEQDYEDGGFEGSAGDGDDDVDDDNDDDDELGMMEYDEDDEETKSRSVVSPTTVSTTVTPSTRTTSTTQSTSTTESLADDDVELIKDDTTESSTSTGPAPRRPRHSQSEDYDYGTIAPPTPRPRRRRPYRYKDERRVPLRDGYYPGRSLKRRKNTKQRTVKPTTTFAPIQTTTESYLKTFNQVIPDISSGRLARDAELRPEDKYILVSATESFLNTNDREQAVPATTPVARRRSKRRKKKVRRQKQSRPQERQISAETRAAIEAAAAAAAAESLTAESDAFPSASTAVSTERLPTTAGPRSVRQNDADVSIQQSMLNPDGSYSFRYDTGDEGHQSRDEKGDPDHVVSGSYSFVDANGKTVSRMYSAGPRGFRATGDDIARKMDLSQLGPAPIPPPDGRYSPEYDRYSDPNEDPSYEFHYKTDTASRQETADSRGDVKGAYSYIDDDGEEHFVSYNAGAEKGFNVESAFPDNKIPPGLFFRRSGRIPERGRSSIRQNRNGAYQFTAVGPNSRREECSDAMNYRRGSYVYLDDKGVRHTVVYEAGPNIGFRVIPNPATLPRCPPARRGWENIPIQIDPRPFYGASPPTSPRPWTLYPDITDRPIPSPGQPPSDHGSTTPDPFDSSPRPPKPSPRPPKPSPRPTKPSQRPTPSTTHKPPVSMPNRPGSSPQPSPPEAQCVSSGSADCSSSTETPWNFIESPGKPPKPLGSASSPGVKPNSSKAFDDIFNTGTTAGTVNVFPGLTGPTPPPFRPPINNPSRDPRPLPSPYPSYHCCRDRLFVDSIDGHHGQARAIRTYIQSIDLSTEDENGPGRAESPSVALERHVREHERKASRRQRRRRRRRRRSAP